MLARVRNWFHPRTFDLGAGETIRLGKLVGASRYKDVYKIRGQRRVIKIMRHSVLDLQGRVVVLEEVRGEEILRNAGVDCPRSFRHDDSGRWVISEYVPEPTIRTLLLSRDGSLLEERFVSSLWSFVERLRRCGVSIDMGIGNIAVRRHRGDVTLMALEPAVDRAGGAGQWFEGIYLPIWILCIMWLDGEQDLDENVMRFEITEPQLETLQSAWEADTKFVHWRNCFGECFPDLLPPWTISREENPRSACLPHAG